jgi:putative tryptophan/tyrosine transport system substrate-binding protein
MRRRDVIPLLGGAAAAWPFAALARPMSDPLRLVGVLMSVAESDPISKSEVAAFQNSLTKLGWTEGSNLRIELRWAAGNPDKIMAFAKELIDLRPEAILVRNTPAVRAVVSETKTIPIVFVVVVDPIGLGLAQSLAHPGGNVTGFTVDDPSLGGKWIQLLRQAAPRTVRVALLFNPATAPSVESYVPSIQAAAASFGIEARVAPVQAKDDIESVIAAQAHTPGGGLVVMPDLFTALNRELIVANADRYGVPAIYSDRKFAESGGLIAYGSDNVEEFRLAAGYIHRILNGAKPADLPIQQPSKFELVINMKAAKALGLDVPPALQQIADEVIE